MLKKFSNYRVIYFDEENVIIHEGLWLALRERSSHTLIDRVRIGRYRDFWKYFELTQRVLRSGFSSYHRDESSFSCVFDKKIIFELSEFLTGGTRVPGSRPLVTSYRDGSMLFGEYSSNKARHSMSVYSISRGQALSKLLELKNIRHIHSVTHLTNSECLVATGDLDAECSLLKLNIFNGSYELLGYGDQTWRLVQPAIKDKVLWYCSDSPDSQNFLYKLELNSGHRQQIMEIDGPVFYMRQVSDFLIFATVAEPSKTQRNNCSLYVYHQKIGSFKKLEFRDDTFSPRIFQYSQILFPEVGDKYCGDEMYFYPRGLAGRHGTFELSLSEFFEG